jgi:hypothetical protein
MFVVPDETAVNVADVDIDVPDMVAAAGLLDVHVTVPVIANGLLFWSKPLTLSCFVSPLLIVSDAGSITSVVRTASGS